MKKALGILGGMGPLATADLFRKIVAMTGADRDQDHIRIYIDSNTNIPDRTEAILSGGPSPLPAMLESLHKLELCGADCIILPCNTAHYYLPALRSEAHVPVLSMVEAAAGAAAARYPGKTAAILATKGTLEAGLYEKTLTDAGIPFLLPDAAERDALMRVIYQGVKADAAPETYRSELEGVMDSLRERGASFFILGCTELPLAVQFLGLTQPVVDAATELARAAIRFCGYPVRNL